MANPSQTLVFFIQWLNSFLDCDDPFIIFQQMRIFIHIISYNIVFTCLKVWLKINFILTVVLGSFSDTGLVVYVATWRYLTLKFLGKFSEYIYSDREAEKKTTKTQKMTGSLFFIYGIWAGHATCDYLLLCDNFKI